MKIIPSILFIVIFQLRCLGQTPKLFEVKEIIATDTLNKKNASNFRRENLNFFEDDKYIVRKTCSGEWGGTVWFKNKKTGVERSCVASCPVIINKLDGKYFVTTTLNHMVGFSQVLEINDPELLTVFKLPKPRAVIGKRIIRAVGDDEAQSAKGSKVLLDTMKVSMLLSFPLNGQLYHLFTDYKKTYLGKLQGTKLVTIDTVSQDSLWSYDTDVIKTGDGHFITFFKNEKVEGYLDVFGNSVNVIRYR
ncbi:hypothetical protein KXD93_10845 [Mucilaginibacter sp. BJC16-A38]|uniref:hypothetical protein n=1 Tax=Mucilaginibacter phenanthrenivorans TaxID=1234842 RepID=UPI00215714CC|nr:hypothetical protein [Mucilaginibacter phenanthrenivorans]MCR8558145.1 hypothetical protein [Mucilaginibacter phenanthrenivorans]